MDAEIVIDEKEFREMIATFQLSPRLMRDAIRRVWRGRFKEFLTFARLFYFSGPPSDPARGYRTPVGKLGRSRIPGRGHLGDDFKMVLKQSRANPESIGTYARDAASGGHSFLLPMHERGTGERFRNRRASKVRHGSDWVGRGRGRTGSLPARHPMQSAIDAFNSYINLEAETTAAIGKALERAAKKSGGPVLPFSPPPPPTARSGVRRL